MKEGFVGGRIEVGVLAAGVDVVLKGLGLGLFFFEPLDFFLD